MTEQGSLLVYVVIADYGFDGQDVLSVASSPERGKSMAEAVDASHEAKMRERGEKGPKSNLVWMEDGDDHWMASTGVKFKGGSIAHFLTESYRVEQWEVDK